MTYRFVRAMEGWRLIFMTLKIMDLRRTDSMKDGGFARPTISLF
jgi:hypothetical protein